MAHKSTQGDMPMKMPPMLSLDESDLPQIKDWKVGGKYTITLEVEQTGSRKDLYEQGDKKNEIRAEFRVIKAHAETGEKLGKRYQ